MAAGDAQKGAATLVVAMALLMGATTWLLSSVRTQWLARRVNANEIDMVRQRLWLDSAFDLAVDAVAKDYRTWAWQPTNTQGEEQYVLPLPLDTIIRDDPGQPPLLATLTRSTRLPHLLHLRASIAVTGNTPSGMIAEQIVRPFGILSPAGEAAPPLVVDGCIRQIENSPDLFPADGPDNTTGPAMWSSRPAGCHVLERLDVHGGAVIGNRFRPGSLWRLLFTVSPEEFARLADDERASQPDEARRRYWWVRPTDLTGGRWSASLGSPESPVALVFPRDLGCPPIVRGTRLVGIVVYEGNCSAQSQVAGHIYGTLALAGTLGSYSESLKLAHVSRLDASVPDLQFPVLSVLRLPGTWKDFR